MKIAFCGAGSAAIPPPPGIGTIELEDGSAVPGFLCESIATRDARGITHLGGWRAFLASHYGAFARFVGNVI